MLYRYALAIACAADGDEMPIKKPEFDEGRTQASVMFYSKYAAARWLIRTGRRYQMRVGRRCSVHEREHNHSYQAG